MRHPRTTPARLLAVLAAAVLTATACGGGDTGGGEAGGGAAGGANLSGASFTVGSKEFTEQLVLGEIAVQALQAAGANVGSLVTITGTPNVRAALVSGEIDMYWEYTGTGWTVHQQKEVSEAPQGAEALYQAVAEADAANGVAWLPFAPLNNTYAIATAQGRDQELGVTTLTEYGELVSRDPAQARMCAAAEFITRDDGLPGLEQTYGFDLPADAVAELELSLIPPQVATGQTCNFGEVFATDGAIASNNLVIIEDDQEAFVAYNAAMTVRQEVLDQNPALADVFGPISQALTTEVMRDLNTRVDVDGELPDEVAASFLEENGFAG
ncbi:MAG TPA: glycine betaine ABC transporter substrate-binding protein [Pseudonocardia sp.]|jgi:osmoprotectant transport system substrate-binding protein|nr:glycine betaine ABC transporter substrate-binding protein [Pseudonocardia sp.]